MANPSSLFLSNKYAKAYFDLIESRKNIIRSSYTETHHIVPRCMGGSDDASNLVKLTAKEHFIAHMLLVKSVSDPTHRSKMAFALSRLVHGNNKQYTNNSRTYKFVQEQNSIASSKRTKEYWEKLTADERSLLRSGENNGRYGKPVSDITKKKISEANKGKQTRLGQKHSNTSKKLMSQNRTGIGCGNIWCHNPVTKEQKILKDIPEGWFKGRLPSKYTSPKAATGKKWYNNPITREVRYFVPGTEPDGFVLGRSIKNG